MDTVLVTGAAGFIGSHVAARLAGAGRRVVALDDLSGGDRDNLPPGVEFVQGSVLDEALLAALFARHRFAQVYHLAAYAAEGLSHFIKGFNYRNNLLGSVNLINLAVRHKVRCFVFTSSIAVYGEIPPPMRETDTPVPADPYGVAKLAVEQELRVTRAQFGLPYVVFRPHNVYGEHQNLADRYRNVIGIFMNQIMRGEELSVFGDGLQTRAFSYVGDILEPLVAAPERPEMWGETYNIGADRPCTVRELAEEVQRAFGSANRLRHLPPRHEAVHAHADHAKIRRLFPDLPQTPLAEGIRRMAAWARTRGPQAPSTFGAIELEEGLPESWRRPAP